MEDSAILDLFFARSEAAVEALAQAYGAPCLRMAQNILGSAEDAEECVSDGYLAAWNAIPPQRPACLRAWFFRVVRNRAVSRWRANAAKKRNSAYDAALEELAPVLPAPEATEDALDARELAALLDRFLDGLDKTTRVIFVRRYWFADPVEDIARDLGMNRSTVSVRLHRARNRLRDSLDKEGYIV